MKLEASREQGKENLSENLRIECAVLTHGRAEARMEGLVVEIEVTTGLDHIAHDAAKSQATAGLLLLALRRQLPVPRLNALLLHRQRPIHLQES